MRRDSVAERAAARADFAAALNGVRVVDMVTKRVCIGRLLHAPVDAVAILFRVTGLGFDDVTLFVALDPEIEPDKVLGAGIYAPVCGFFEGTARRGTKQEAQYEAVKYLLRIPAEEREAAARLMIEHGSLWRAKR